MLVGSVRLTYFQDKYHVNILERFKAQFASLAEEGELTAADDQIVSLSRHGLLRIDSLLPRFFLPRHTGIRYT